MAAKMIKNRKGDKKFRNKTFFYRANNLDQCPFQTLSSKDVAPPNIIGYPINFFYHSTRHESKRMPVITFELQKDDVTNLTKDEPTDTNFYTVKYCLPIFGNEEHFDKNIEQTKMAISLLANKTFEPNLIIQVLPQLIESCLYSIVNARDKSTFDLRAIIQDFCFLWHLYWKLVQVSNILL